MSIRVFFAWFDLWIGAYWDRKKHILYLCPLPCVVIALHFDATIHQHDTEVEWVQVRAALALIRDTFDWIKFMVNLWPEEMNGEDLDALEARADALLGDVV